MNSAINLEWMQKVFEHSTREHANGRPRILINNGFETYESLDVLTFCFKKNIVLCRLPSHTSHKLQPLSSQSLTTPTTAEGVHSLYRILEEKLMVDGTTSDPCLQKLIHAT
jgi:hypothetical protein